MTWIQRFPSRSFLSNSVWLPPLIGMVGAIVIHRLVRSVDIMMGWKASFSPDGARALIAALYAPLQPTRWGWVVHERQNTY